jgi:hypothetical protein
MTYWNSGRSACSKAHQKLYSNIVWENILFETLRICFAVLNLMLLTREESVVIMLGKFCCPNQRQFSRQKQFTEQLFDTTWNTMPFDRSWQTLTLLHYVLYELEGGTVKYKGLKTLFQVEAPRLVPISEAIKFSILKRSIESSYIHEIPGKFPLIRLYTRLFEQVSFNRSEYSLRGTRTTGASRSLLTLTTKVISHQIEHTSWPHHILPSW